MKACGTDTETTGLFIHKGCKPFTVSSASDIDCKKRLWKGWVDPKTREVDFPKRYTKEIQKEYERHDVIVFHNANFDLQALEAIGIPAKWFFDNFYVCDTMVMSHAYKSSNRHGLKELALLLARMPDKDEHFLSVIVKEARAIAKKMGWSIATEDHEHLEGLKKEIFRSDYWIPYQLAVERNYPMNHPWRQGCDEYAMYDAERTLVVYHILKELLSEIPCESKYAPTWYDKTGTLLDKAREAEELIYPIFDMQKVTIPVKPKALNSSIVEYESRLETSHNTMQKILNQPTFNPRSPNQLQKALFDRFKFKPSKMGKTGPSADKTVISKLLSEGTWKGDKIPDKYRFLLSLTSSRKEQATLNYLRAYKLHSKKTGTLTTTYLQTKTGTGRLSSENPNATNVGKKNMANPFADDRANKERAAIFAEILGIEQDERFSLRHVFGPKRGDQWTCIDYDQFQLRIFAIVSESYELIEGFERGEDIHQLVARTIFGKEDISDVERTAAKAINFGLLFGAGPTKIELMAGMPGLYNLFMANFPKAKRYLDTQSDLARKYGYVHTVGGYRLYVPKDAPYAASCYVIQGTEAEIARRAMVYNHQRQLANPNRTYTQLMMIHDEFIFTSSRTNRVELRKIMDLMERAGKEIGIPAKVDAKITTTNWADRKSLDLAHAS